MKAFFRNAPEAYTKYKEGLSTGESKVNAGAVYPYEISQLLSKEPDLANRMWLSQPDYMQDVKSNVLPVVDVSGSMFVPVANSTALNIAISLGMYISERNSGMFKDAFVTFSNDPKVQYCRGDLQERYSDLEHADWGFSTNIQAVFDLLLKSAKKEALEPTEMPSTVIILSDMEFNSPYVKGKDVMVFKAIKKVYKKAGYKMPKLVFWNIKGRAGNTPVRMDTTGTAMVSGFSPSLMTKILSGESFTPESLMLDVIEDERYKL